LFSVRITNIRPNFYFGFNRCFYDNSAQFDAKTIEDKWYDYWMKTIIFIEPDIEPYTIVIPPKCYWSFTHGVLKNNTIQDVLIRRARLKGFNACWVPGTIMLL
jgi:valyl-tRNA synthetase